MKKLYTIFIVLFLTMIVFPTLWVFTTDDITFSDNENRMLQTAPKLSAKNVADGSFQEDITAYISDQFPARDTWTAVGSRVKKLIGMKDIGGAYLCSDGSCIEKLTQNDVDSTKFRANLGLVQTFAEDSGCKTTLLLVPAAGTVLSDKLPRGAEMYDAEALYKTAEGALTGVTLPDLYTALTGSDSDYLFYRTDHHWTQEGARAAYNCFTGGHGACKAVPDLFSDAFHGTTYSKTLDATAPYDSVYTIPVPNGITVTADGKDIPFYDRDAQNEKDKYKVFFGGNYGQLTIEGGTGEGTLLIIKDSFANSLAPYLTYDYAKIIMLDMRYFMGSALELVKSENVDEVLFVNEMSSFSKDNNLVKLAF